MRALSIMQPWAWLIANGHKDIENRTWGTGRRGETLIHAGKAIDRMAMDEILHGEHPVTGEDFALPGLPTEEEFKAMCGGIVGACEIAGCTTLSQSEWFVGPYGFLIRNARPLPFQPCRGQLGFFKPDFTPPEPKPINRDLLNYRDAQ